MWVLSLAQHDPLSGECAPGGFLGNFIMFRSATNGEQTNNRRFSSCSLNSIRPILMSKADCFEGNVNPCTLKLTMSICSKYSIVIYTYSRCVDDELAQE